MTDRHLRVVTPPLAGFPDSYTCRRPGSDQAEAILSGGGGHWFVMYGFDPDATEPHLQWRASAALPLVLDLPIAADHAVELAEAYATGVPHWHELLAAAMRFASSPALSIARLHAPFAARQAGDEPMLPAVCTGEGEQASPLWLACPTVRLLAVRLGVGLPLAPG